MPDFDPDAFLRSRQQPQATPQAFDPDQFLRSRQPQPEPQAPPERTWGGFAADVGRGVGQGLLDPIEGVTQMAEHGLSAASEAMGGGDVRLVPQGVRDWARNYRRQAGSTWAGTLGEIAGNIVNPVNYIPGSLAVRGARALPWLGRLASRVGTTAGAAVSGATAGVMQPTEVPQGSDFATQKFLQAGTGAALGGGLARLAQVAETPLAAFNRWSYGHVLEPLGLNAPREAGPKALDEMRGQIGGRIDQIMRQSGMDQQAIGGFHNDLRAILTRAESDLSGDTQRALRRVLRDDVLSATQQGALSGERLQRVFSQLSTAARQADASASRTGDEMQRELARTLDRVTDRLMANAQIGGGGRPALEAARQSYARWAELQREADPLTGLAHPRDLLASEQRRQGTSFWANDPRNEALRAAQRRVDRAPHPLARLAGRAAAHATGAGMAHAVGLPWWVGSAATEAVAHGAPRVGQAARPVRRGLARLIENAPASHGGAAAVPAAAGAAIGSQEGPRKRLVVTVHKTPEEDR